MAGHMYVPMETNPVNSKAGSRENTDYDTFGSIDSLIFEPKIPTQVTENIICFITQIMVLTFYIFQ